MRKKVTCVIPEGTIGDISVYEKWLVSYINHLLDRADDFSLEMPKRISSGIKTTMGKLMLEKLRRIPRNSPNIKTYYTIMTLGYVAAHAIYQNKLTGEFFVKQSEPWNSSDTVHEFKSRSDAENIFKLMELDSEVKWREAHWFISEKTVICK
jgi:hypothetical protein